MGRGTRCLCGLANITLVKHSLQQLARPVLRVRCTLHREWDNTNRLMRGGLRERGADRILILI